MPARSGEPGAPASGGSRVPLADRFSGPTSKVTKMRPTTATRENPPASGATISTSQSPSSCNSPVLDETFNWGWRSLPAWCALCTRKGCPVAGRNALTLVYASVLKADPFCWQFFPQNVSLQLQVAAEVSLQAAPFWQGSPGTRRCSSQVGPRRTRIGDQSQLVVVHQVLAGPRVCRQAGATRQCWSRSGAPRSIRHRHS